VEHDLADVRRQLLVHRAQTAAADFGRVARDLPEFVKRARFAKLVGLQQQLILAVLNLIRGYDSLVQRLLVARLCTHPRLPFVEALVLSENPTRPQRKPVFSRHWEYQSIAGRSIPLRSNLLAWAFPGHLCRFARSQLAFRPV